MSDALQDHDLEWRILDSAVIPSLRNRAVPRDIDRERYKDRNPVERFWARAKQYRRVATRYDKTARNVLAFVHLVSIMILLR